MRKITLFLMLFCMSIGTALSGNYVPGNRTLTLEAGKKYFISTAMNYHNNWGSSLHLLYTNTSGTLTRSSISPASTITDESYLFTVEEVGADYLVYLKNSKDKYVQADNLNSTETKTGLYVIPYHIAKNVCCGDDVNALDENGNIIAYADITADTPVVTVQKNKDYTNRDTKGGWRYLPTENLTAGMNNWSTPFAFYEVIDLDAELNAELNAKKDALNSKIQQAENLLSTAGFSFVPGEKVTLQASDLYSNADHNTLNPGQKDGDGLGALIDGNIDTYFHTSWGDNKPDAYHYLQVDLGDANKVSEFLFNYTTRKGPNRDQTSPAPTKIEVYAGNSVDNMKLLTTISSGLPTYWPAAQTYQSDVISTGESCRYLRFQVTGSAGPGNNGYDVGSTHYYFFCMAEFGLSLPEKVVVTNSNYEGMEQQLKNLNQEVNEAKTIAEGSNLQDLETAIQELSNLLSNFVHEVNIGDAKWSSLVLAKNAAIPANVTAYVVSELGSDWATLTEVEDAIPANEPVLLNAEKGVYSFEYVNDATSVVTNHLKGTLVNEYIQAAENTTYYVLGVVDGVVGLYKALINKDATGGNGTTHFLNNANKAYLSVTNAKGANMIRFNFGGETTAIDGAEVESTVKTIYDLSGRKVSGMSAPGLYIVNGKKVLVK